MLLLANERTITVEGVTLLPDHADDSLFWCMPGEVKLARRTADDRADFTMMKFKPAVADAGIQGGGYLTFEVDLKLTPEMEQKVLSKLSSVARNPRLAAVQFDEGTVQCIALDLQGSGGTTQTGAAPPGTFHAVEKILGASKPSLFGDNTAAFSLVLDQEGAIIVEQAFKGGATPVGVVYDLKFTGLRPALQVKITVDYKRVYNQFSASLQGQYYWFKLGIDAAIEDLKQKGAIKIEVLNFSTAQEQKDREKWALDFLKDQLLKDWFEPTLSPGTIQGPPAGAGGIQLPNLPGVGGAGGNQGGGGSHAGGGGSQTGGAGSQAGGGGSQAGGAGSQAGGGGSQAGGSHSGSQSSGTSSQSGGGSQAGGGAGAQAGGGSQAAGGAGAQPGTGAQAGSGTAAQGGLDTPPGSTGVTGSPSGAGASGQGGGTAPATGGITGAPGGRESAQPVQLEVTERDARTPGSGPHNIMLAPTTSDTRQPIRLEGADAYVLRVGGQVLQPDPDGSYGVDVTAGTDVLIEAEFQGPETFKLFFDFDEPPAAGWSVSPPAALYRKYTSGDPANPPDDRFNTSDPPSGDATQHGRPALVQWLRTRVIGSPKEVDIDAHASFEGDNRTEVNDPVRYNMDLSRRRLDVATGISRNEVRLRNLAARGSSRAAQLQHPSLPEDRVAEVTGRVVQEVVKARLSRAAGTQGQGDTPQGQGSTPQGQGNTPQGQGNTPQGQGNTPQGQGNTPQGQGNTPQGQGNTPQGQGNTPQGQGGQTQGQGGQNQGQGGKPQGQGGQGQGGQGQGQGQGNTQTPSNTTAGDPSIALKLRFVHQEELKTLSFTYTSSEAVQRTFAPQGFFGLMLADLEKKDHFIEVDLDDPFFRVLSVSMEAPFDFAGIGLHEVHAALDYGAKESPEHKHGEFVFDATHPGPQKFEVFLNSKRETSYQLGLQYNFKPESGWDGEKFTYDMPVRTVEDRTLILNPFADLGFLQVEVTPGRIDAGVVTSTDVILQYRDSGGFQATETINVRADSAPQTWRVRLSDPSARSYTFKLVHHLKDGTTRETLPVTSQASAISVDDPFEDALNLDFMLFLDPSRTKRLFIDVEYEDAAHKYKREERLEISPDQGTSDVRLRIALLDRNLRTFRFRTTMVGPAGEITRGQLIESQDQLIVINDQSGAGLRGVGV